MTNKHVLSVGLALLVLCSCGTKPKPGGGGSGGSGSGALPSTQFEFQFGVAGGVIQGTATNRGRDTVGRAEVRVSVQDRSRRHLGSKQLTLGGPFRPGEATKFRLVTGFAAGAHAQIHVVRGFR
ncbi:MAG: FxLYD domain-containing protein [Planctomycetes bacterium]|nr:FxLYD domain-containing protein [Planctomycetota bacterium]MCB9871336.1 hypothetical protein [Planctomycetota bacterium]MCB9888590.1 hypothetical protein [Planctomycetota bacterium]